MKKTLNLLVSSALLGSTLALMGCSTTSQPEPKAAESAAVTSAATTAETKVTGDIGKAKLNLEKATVALKEKNYASAISSVNAASQELTAVAANSNLPAPIKETIAKASTNLEPIKTLIESKDTSAEKSLLAAIARLGKLNDMTKMMSGAANALNGALKAGVAEKTGITMSTKQ